MSDKFHLFEELTYLASFFYLLFSINTFQYFYETLLSVYVFLFVLYLFITLSIYNQNDVKNIAFNAGFTIGLLALADKHLIVFAVVLFLMLILSRAVYWREWLLALIGVVLPLFYAALFEYLNISLPFILKIGLNNLVVTDIVHKVYMFTSFLLLMTTLIYMGRKTVRKRNIYTVILITITTAVVLYWLANKNWIVFFITPVMAILFTHLYYRLHKQILRSILVLLVFGLSIFSFFLT
jgi:hypothetical protein